jgi:hypothetical protein
VGPSGDWVLGDQGFEGAKIQHLKSETYIAHKNYGATENRERCDSDGYKNK